MISKPSDLAVYGDTSAEDTSLISTYGYMSFAATNPIFPFIPNYADVMLDYLPEQFKSQPWSFSA